MALWLWVTESAFEAAHNTCLGLLGVGFYVCFILGCVFLHICVWSCTHELFVNCCFLQSW